jgi:hypothetical protein
VTVQGETAWVIQRDAAGRVVSLSNTVHDVEVDRDAGGIVTGVTATEL